MAFHSILLLKQLSNGVAYSDHLLEAWHHEAFDAFPHLLHPRSSHQFRRLGEIFMTVIDHLNAFQLRDEKVRQRRIEIIGKQQVSLMEQQEEEQSDIVFRVKQWSLLK